MASRFSDARLGRAGSDERNSSVSLARRLLTKPCVHGKGDVHRATAAASLTRCIAGTCPPPSPASSVDVPHLSAMNADHHHTHGVRTATGFARRDVARLLRRITVSCAVLIMVGAIVLWPDGGEPVPIRCGWPPIRSMRRDDRRGTAVPLGLRRSNVTSCRSNFVAAKRRDRRLVRDRHRQPDRSVTTSRSPPSTSRGGTTYSFYDFQRSTPMLVLVAVRRAVVASDGGAVSAPWPGLVISLVVIVWFALPSLVDGNNAVAVALVTAGAVAIVALYLAHGVGPATDVALLSTFASLALTGAAGVVVRPGGHASPGSPTTPPSSCRRSGPGIDPAGSCSPASSSARSACSTTSPSPRSPPSGSSTGPDPAGRHVGVVHQRPRRSDAITSPQPSTPCSWPTPAPPCRCCCCSAASTSPSPRVATREIVATEIVRALVGSIGLVASVPISTWLATNVVLAGHPPHP